MQIIMGKRTSAKSVDAFKSLFDLVAQDFDVEWWWEAMVNTATFTPGNKNEGSYVENMLVVRKILLESPCFLLDSSTICPDELI